MRIEVNWLYAQEGEEAFEFTRVLYAYLHPKSKRILYLGKADYCTVRERTKGTHKTAIFDAMIENEGVNILHPIVGVLSLEVGTRFSSKLLSDVESLLIIELQPPYNKQSIRSRISRPGIEVNCTGTWPVRRKRYRDE
jgi:hypothetical protein